MYLIKEIIIHFLIMLLYYEIMDSFKGIQVHNQFMYNLNSKHIYLYIMFYK